MEGFTCIRVLWVPGRQVSALGQQPSMQSCPAGMKDSLCCSAGGGQGGPCCLCSKHLQTSLTHECYEKAAQTHTG